MSNVKATLDLVTTQLGALQRRHPTAHIELTTDNQRVLVIPDVPLPVGWSKQTVTIRVLVSGGYPQVKLDCFYVDADLHLGGGGQPSQSGMQQVFGSTYLWFSWHINDWSPQTASLDQYVRVCEARLREVR